MNFTRVLRPAQKILTATVVASVATTCLVTASTQTSAAPQQGSHVGPAKTKEWATKEWRGKTAAPDKVLATKEWRGKTAAPDTVMATKEWRGKASSAPLVNVAQSAYPAMGTSTYESKTKYWVNVVRRRHHLRALTFASCANRVANTWSSHLASTHTFYHQSMTRLLRVCHAHYSGETLGMGNVKPRKLVDMWMHSAPHRHILMSSSPRRIGIGATPNSRGQWVVAANFMRF